MAIPNHFNVSPYIASILLADTPQNLRSAINRVLMDLGTPIAQQEESLQDVADRVCILNPIIADCIRACC